MSKRHLIGSKSKSLTACGMEIDVFSEDGYRDHARSVTNTPAHVTCERCKGTVTMADAEVRSRQRRRQK